MGALAFSSSSLGNSLQELLMADDIVPGASPSYQTCKSIYLYHPLGAKMAESPIAMAQFKPREVSVPGSPEDEVKEAFTREWERLGADRHIFDVGRLSRVYGIASVAMLTKGAPCHRRG